MEENSPPYTSFKSACQVWQLSYTCCSTKCLGIFMLWPYCIIERSGPKSYSDITKQVQFIIPKEAYLWIFWCKKLLRLLSSTYFQKDTNLWGIFLPSKYLVLTVRGCFGSIMVQATFSSSGLRASLPSDGSANVVGCDTVLRNHLRHMAVFLACRTGHITLQSRWLMYRLVWLFFFQSLLLLLYLHKI